jgi:hypothetical protein
VIATSVPAPTVTLVPVATTSQSVTSPPVVEVTIGITAAPDDSEQATLIPQEGRVELQRSWETTFTTLLPNQAVLVSSGDIIRTGPTGQARLLFEPNTETIIYADTVLVLDTYVRNDDNSLGISLTQLIGSTFSRVNFSNSNSRQSLVTPYGVASVRGTGYWVDVVITGPLATMLLTQDLANFEAEVGAAIASGDFSALLNAVVALLGAEAGTVSVDVGTGAVSFTDGSGTTVSITTGNTGNSGTDANGNTITVTTTVIDRFCGDGICDAYLDEQADTCLVDC